MLELWLVVIGSLTHSLYPFSGSNPLVGLLAPINESLWEHFKMGYTAMLLWLPLSRRVFGYSRANLWLPTIVGVFTITLTEVLVFFLIRPWIDDRMWTLVVDISSYVLGSILAGVLIRRWPNTIQRSGEATGVLLWVLVGLVFAYCTVFPPSLPLFIEKGL